jgi:hypothetical protein
MTYSVFVKEGSRYTRVTALALSLASARRLFQGILLDGAMMGLHTALRPAREDFDNSEVYDNNRRRLFNLK